LNNAVAIIGCGWLGLPLGKKLIEVGFKVQGSTTSENKIDALSNAGIIPFMVSLSENAITGHIDKLLDNATILIINVPPKLRGERNENYVSKMQLLLNALQKSKIKKVLFVSSTAVYGDISGDVTEKTTPQPNTESGKQLLASENIFTTCPQFETTIVRFGGLIGLNRHPINMLSGRKNLRNGNHPINLIHLDDCINILLLTLKNNWWGELINAVYPNHPTKSTYYTQKANEQGLISPGYLKASIGEGKKIVSNRLLNVKKYVFHTSI